VKMRTHGLVISIDLSEERPDGTGAIWATEETTMSHYALAERIRGENHTWWDVLSFATKRVFAETDLAKLRETLGELAEVTGMWMMDIDGRLPHGGHAEAQDASADRVSA